MKYQALSALLIAIIGSTHSLDLPPQNLPNGTNVTTSLGAGNGITQCTRSIIGLRNPDINDCSMAILSLPATSTTGDIRYQVQSRTATWKTCTVNINVNRPEQVSWLEVIVAANLLSTACSLDILAKTGGTTTVGEDGGIGIALARS